MDTSVMDTSIMDTDRAEALRKELGQLLRKQTEVLESRTFGAAIGTDILEYEIRQEIIHEMCNQLANSEETACKESGSPSRLSRFSRSA